MAKIPDSPESIFEEFTQDIQSVYNSDLTSIVLYGSGAKGEYVPKKSDINFLIVLSQKGIENLDKALELIPKWQKRNVAVPLFLTKEYIAITIANTPIASAIKKKIISKNNSWARGPIIFSAISPIERPRFRIETTRADKSWIPPKKMVPKNTQRKAGNQPQITAMAGPRIGPRPVIDAK